MICKSSENLLSLLQSDCNKNPTVGWVGRGLSLAIAFWPHCVSCFVSVPSLAELPHGAAVPLRVRNDWRRSRFFSQPGKCSTKSSFIPSAASSPRCLQLWDWGESWRSRGLFLPLTSVESVYSCCAVDKELLGYALLWCSGFRHRMKSLASKYLFLISLHQPEDMNRKWQRSSS